MFDDIINGNVTADGKNFFTGVTKLTQSLTALDGQIGTVNTQMGNLNTALTSVVSDLNAAKGFIDLVPTGVAGGTADIKYNSKIHQSPIAAANVGIIKSTLNSLLGSSTSGTGIVGGFYQAISTTHATLSGIATDSNGFATNSGTNLPTSQINSINNDLTKVSNQVLDLDKSLKKGL